MDLQKYKIKESALVLILGDITLQKTDAIVNAANTALAPGGGVSGAIHRTAGPELWEECKKLGGCKTGEVKITKGYDLPAKHVIHTVGPVFGQSLNDAIYLASCYKNSLKIAGQNDLESISFPSISTGIFGYPVKGAAEIAIKTILQFLLKQKQGSRSRGVEGKHFLKHKGIKLVQIVLFSESDFLIYKNTAEKIVDVWIS